MVYKNKGHFFHALSRGPGTEWKWSERSAFFGTWGFLLCSQQVFQLELCGYKVWFRFPWRSSDEFLAFKKMREECVKKVIFLTFFTLSCVRKSDWVKENKFWPIVVNILHAWGKVTLEGIAEPRNNNPWSKNDPHKGLGPFQPRWQRFSSSIWKSCPCWQKVLNLLSQMDGRFLTSCRYFMQWHYWLSQPDT